MMIGLGEMYKVDLVKSQGYIGHFCDQLCKQFLLNILKVYLL